MFEHNASLRHNGPRQSSCVQVGLPVCFASECHLEEISPPDRYCPREKTNTVWLKSAKGRVCESELLQGCPGPIAYTRLVSHMC